MYPDFITCDSEQRTIDPGCQYNMILCERCKGTGYCRKYAGENIVPYFAMIIDEDEFRNIVRLRIPKDELQDAPFLIQLNEALEHFHFKEYEQSLAIFRELDKEDLGYISVVYGLLCSCYFTMNYEEAISIAITMDYSINCNYDYRSDTSFSDRIIFACNERMAEIEWRKEQEAALNPMSSLSIGFEEIKLYEVVAANTIADKHFKAVVKAIENMNHLRLCFLLDERKTYQNFPKHEFLNKLVAVFEKFYELGDDQLLSYKGSCGSKTCGNYSMPGYRFEGNYSGAYINLIFEYYDNELIDICECNDLACERLNLNVQDRIYLDQDKYGFNPDKEYFKN